MNRIACFCLAVFVAAGTLVSLSAAQGQSDSLGAYAKAYQKDKKAPAAHQYDNDNIPKTDKLSVVGPAPEPDADAAQDADKPADSAAASDPQNGDPSKPAEASDKKDDGSPAEKEAERQKMFKDWQGKISAQKNQVDNLSHEIDIMEREYRLRSVAFYSDAGNRLRNSAQWDREDAQYKQNLAEKQKALEAAKKGLDDMQEAARKAGVPAGMRE